MSCLGVGGGEMGLGWEGVIERLQGMGLECPTVQHNLVFLVLSM